MNGNAYREWSIQLPKTEFDEIKKKCWRLQIFKTKTNKQCPISEGLINHVIDVVNQQPRK